MRRFITSSIIRWAVPMVMLAALGLHGLTHAGTAAVRAQPAPAGACSDATLNGTYASLASGWTLLAADGSALPVPSPRSAVALFTYDGAGGLTGSISSNAGGTVGHSTVTGTYTVNADCSGTLTQTNASGASTKQQLVITGGGSEFYELDATTDHVSSAERVLLPSGPCSNASLSGKYSYWTNGSALQAADGTPLPSPLPQMFIGTVNADGAGHTTATATVNTGGTVTQELRTATYSIKADCTATFTVNSPGLPDTHREGVVTGGGTGMYLIGTDPGAVFTQELEQQ